MKTGDLPTSPGEVAEVIRERVAALNVVLSYAYSLDMRVGLDFVDSEDEDVAGELVNVDCIEQVLSL